MVQLDQLPACLSGNCCLIPSLRPAFQGHLPNGSNSKMGSSSNKTNFNSLPEDCVSTILSLTSPLDACRSTLVSSTFKSSVESDLVWEKFLPPDYKDLVSRLFDPVSVSTSSSPVLGLFRNLTKKELFFHMCSSVLIDGGNKILTLEKASGLKSYIVSPRELTITWSDVPTYWCWKPLPQSRFREIAELITTSWLEIRGEINLKFLSPNTIYGAYLIYRATERSYGLDTMPMEASLKIGDRAESRTAVRLRQHCEREQITTMMEEVWYSHRSQMLTSRLENVSGSGKWEEKLKDERQSSPKLREGGYWMEMELGKFFVDNSEGDSGDRTVKMSIMEVKGHHLKGGLIIGGIQVRPELRL